MHSLPESRAERLGLLNPGNLIVSAVFIVSRILYHMTGLPFDSSPVERFWQYIDPVLMKTRLLQSLFYLHMQPPGFNLAVGLVVQLFPNSWPVVLRILYLIMGAGIGFSLLRLMRILRVPEPIAVALTCVFLVNPGLVLYENSAVYEYPILLLLLLAAIALFRLCRGQSRAWSLAFFGLLFALAMIRNIFHPVFLALIAAALIWRLPRARGAILTGALPALALILGVQTKNWILFGTFSTSTWASMNTGVVTTFQLTPEETKDLVKRGVISPMAAIPPFSDLALYRDLIPPPAPTGIPVLDQATTSTGHPNFNNPAYLPIGASYVRDAKAILLHYPAAYTRSVAIAWFAYFLPTSDLHVYDRFRPILQPFDRIYSMAVFGQFRQAASRKDLRAIRASEGIAPLVLYTGIWLLVGLPLLVLWGLWQFLPGQRARWTSGELTVLGFMLVTILFSTAVSNMLSTFENNRYRFPLDGYYTAIAGMALTPRRKRQGL